MITVNQTWLKLVERIQSPAYRQLDSFIVLNKLQKSGKAKNHTSYPSISNDQEIDVKHSNLGPIK